MKVKKAPSEWTGPGRPRREMVAEVVIEKSSSRKDGQVESVGRLVKLAVKKFKRGDNAVARFSPTQNRPLYPILRHAHQDIILPFYFLCDTIPLVLRVIRDQ